MVCGNDYVNFICMFYSIALGYGPVHMWRSLCQLEVLFTVQGPFTSRSTVTCMFRSHVQLLFTGRDSKLRDCEYI